MAPRRGRPVSAAAFGGRPGHRVATVSAGGPGRAYRALRPFGSGRPLGASRALRSGHSSPVAEVGYLVLLDGDRHGLPCQNRADEDAERDGQASAPGS
ncbi:hypothetical protein GCM10010302_75530 [Streptomyces polychromogenes]|uniref:Uncharacterized protein n=1 Tax=Streptomyces polychromogenes TaxID=67342 RepID=A0ABN0W505_9ACTN